MVTKTKPELLSFPADPWSLPNAMLDEVFYDTEALTPAEREQLVARKTPEGAVLVVPPSGHEEALRILPVRGFIEEMLDGALEIDTLAAAGVGSSDLGTAALARNVADYLARPVAGVVSGHGLLDTLTEGMGGWFFFGYANLWRELVSKAMDLVGSWGLPGLETFPLSGGLSEDEVSALERRLAKHQSLPRIPFADWLALAVVLLFCHERIKLVVGHSKGNYLVASAVDLLAKYADVKAPKVVTLGAVVYMDEERVPDQQQILGSMDWFGWMNSRKLVGYTPYPMAWHWIGAGKPAAMQVDRALEMAGVERG